MIKNNENAPISERKAPQTKQGKARLREQRKY